MKYLRLLLALPFLVCGVLTLIVGAPLAIAAWIFFNSGQLIAGTTVVDVSGVKFSVGKDE